jgi:hypothetical protein
MRPFRFFFMFSLGILLFLFVGRFILFALLGAAILSLIFFIGRKVMTFFRGMDWEGHPSGYYGRGRMKPVWKNDMLLEYPRPISIEQSVKAERVIEVQ